MNKRHLEKIKPDQEFDPKNTRGYSINQLIGNKESTIPKIIKNLYM